MRHYWDLEPLCRRFDIVPLALYARHVRAGPTHSLGPSTTCVRHTGSSRIPSALHVPCRQFAPGHRTTSRHRRCREKAVVHPRQGKDGIGMFRLRSARAVERAFGALSGSALIELRGWWRSVTNTEAARNQLRYEGATMRPSVWELNPGYEHLAVSLLGAATPTTSRGRYLAVQWRSEDWQVRQTFWSRALAAACALACAHTRPEALPRLTFTLHHASFVPRLLQVQLGSADSERRKRAVANESHTMRQCALWAAQRIRVVMATHGLTQAFLATDLRAGTSTTYENGAAQLEALTALEEAVPPLRNDRLRGLLDAIADTGVRAGVETALCTQATFMLTTTTNCRNCRRAARCSKMSSAFGEHCIIMRTAGRRRIVAAQESV